MATAGSKTTDRAFSLIVKDKLAWDILGGISSSGGNAMNSAAYLYNFLLTLLIVVLTLVVEQV